MQQVKLGNRVSVRTAELLDEKKSLLNHKIGGRYTVIQLLSEGVFGAIYKAIDTTKNVDSQVLIKTVLIKKIKSQSQERAKKQRLALIIREETILRKLNDPLNVPFIIPLENIYQNSDFKLIITKYCNQGTLADLINKFGSIEVPHAINILKQMVQALSAMNIKGEINRVLKPEQIYIHNSRYMIGDFGLTDLINGTSNEKEFEAPEVQTGKYNLNVEIYSLGALLFCMLYPKGSIKERYQKIKSLNIDNLSLNLKNGKEAPQKVKIFLKGTLKQNPKDRIKWDEVINHCLFEIEETEKISSQYYKPCKLDDIPECRQSTQIYMTNQINLGQLGQLEIRSEGQQLELSLEDEEKIIKLRTVSQGSETEINKKLRKLHVKAKKCQFLYRFLNQITNCKHFDQKNRNTIELLYLLAARCLSCINEVVYNREKSEQFNKEFKDFRKQNKVDDLYMRCMQVFETNGKKLTAYENKWNIIIYDFFSQRIRRFQETTKNNLMNGCQNADYSKEEHIRFIQQKLNNMPRITNQNQQEKRLFSIIDSFTDVNLMDEEELMNQDFDQAINLQIQKKR